MKPLDCIARAQGDIEAELVELSSKACGQAGPVDAVEMIGSKVGGHRQVTGGPGLPRRG